jgi:lathosterol oxidase
MLYCSVSEAAISVGKNMAVEMLSIDTPSDATIATVYIFLGYILIYFMVGGALEFTNPKGVNSKVMSPQEVARRRVQVKAEIKLGVRSLLVTVGLTALHLFYSSKWVWTYGFFDTHQYNIWWFLGSLVMYVFWFDTWFYWSHRWLHDYDFLWNNVHFIHHRFKEPSAFAQFAVHPIEAALQGPVGHYMATFFFPVHPVVLNLLGFMGSLYALGAHDGREFDLNNHYLHHSKGRGRFIYFNLGYLTPYWDQICNTKWYEAHPQWQRWKEKRGKEIFDTQDGTKKISRQ